MADPTQLIRHLRRFQEELPAVAACSAVDAREARKAQALLVQALDATSREVAAAGNIVEEYEPRVAGDEEQLAVLDDRVPAAAESSRRAATHSRRLTEVAGLMQQRCGKRLAAAEEELSRVDAQLSAAGPHQRERLLDRRRRVAQLIECCQAALEACRRAGGLAAQAAMVAGEGEQAAAMAVDSHRLAGDATRRARALLSAADSASWQARQAMVAASA